MRIIVTGTFYHEGWFRSHIVPLARSGVDEVIVVCDEPRDPIPGVRFCCPPKWARAVLGRAISKAIWMIAAGRRYPTEVFIGFHIFPGALSALVAAGVHGKASCYQSTGGPIEVLGGGADNENWFMQRLKSPSAYLEHLAIRVVCLFDCVVVRGRQAERFFSERGLDGRVAIIPGSVDGVRFAPGASRDYDLVFVGRLSEIKQPWQFVEIAAAVHRVLPSMRAAVVGDGPLMADLRKRADDLGVGPQIDWLGKCDQVGAVLSRSRIFVLTSRSEGLSIALAEAMTCGLPAVVADVGELRDLVTDGVTGWVVPPGDIDGYARRIIPLLEDDATWRTYSGAARDAALRHTSVDRVSRVWSTWLRRLRTRPYSAAPAGPGLVGRFP